METAKKAKMSEDEIRKARPRFVRSLRINYYHDIPVEAPCLSIFKDFKEHISRYTWEQYSSGTSLECRERPWKEDVQNRAKFIVETAIDLSKGSVDEADWRAQLEHHIFLRFESEVTWYVVTLWSSSRCNLVLIASIVKVAEQNCGSPSYRCQYQIPS